MRHITGDSRQQATLLPDKLDDHPAHSMTYPIVYLDCIVLRIRQDNRVIRKAVKKRKVFPHDQAAIKAVYLAIEVAAKKWSMPIRDWKGALNRFMIELPERMPEAL